MDIDHSLPPTDWSKPLTVEALLQRARILAPMTLADETDRGLENLTKLVDQSPRGDVPDPGTTRAAVSNTLFTEFTAFWKADPNARSRWTEPGNDSVPWTVPDDLLTILGDGRNQDERMKARDDWHIIRRITLRQLVASATYINDQAITAALLRQERDDLLRLFGMMLEAENDTDTDAVTVEIDKRLAMAGPTIRVTFESDHLKTLAIPRFGDLGAHSTISLIEMFRQFPLGGLGRCSYAECRRLFIPGTDGRKRTTGVKYCSAYCRREAEAQVRRRES